MTDDNVNDCDTAEDGAKAREEEWRRRLGDADDGTLESMDAGPGVDDRIEVAREEMRRIVIDRLGGDAALLSAVAEIALTGHDAALILKERMERPTAEHFDALEAIVAFDGTRPSFLLQSDEIDFASSYATDTWKMTLIPARDRLRRFASCVGRVELGDAARGTAFLVSPTLAITNRHVAQLIATFSAEGVEVEADAFVDFGREHAGRKSYDRRPIKAVLLAGDQAIKAPIDHDKLDLALLELGPSLLKGEVADRFLRIAGPAGDVVADQMIATVGYPGDWQTYVPLVFQTAYAEVLAKLLDGLEGSKRFAPGVSTGMRSPAPGARRWTATHDATTINGNSGSPLALLASGDIKVTGLHYGGQWAGARTNWAHVLANCAEAVCAPDQQTLGDALAARGIVL